MMKLDNVKMPKSTYLFLLICSLFVFTFDLYAQDNAKLKVKIKGLKNSNGKVGVSLYKTKDGFPDKSENAVRNGLVSIVNNEAIIEWEGLPMGEYAISIMHDENENNKMDTNFMGIPKEGFGFSNGAKAKFGPPSFDKAKFSLSQEMQDHQIEAQYMDIF